MHMTLSPIQYSVSTPNPDSHLFHISMHIADIQEDVTSILLSMPAWSPGSYLIREYARHIQNISASLPDGTPLHITQQDKATWKVSFPAHTPEVNVNYEVFSHELAVRTNHLDATHGSLNGVSTFLYPHGQLDRSSEITFDVPAQWRVATGLTCLDKDKKIYLAENFDILFDTPVELGCHTSIYFDVLDVPHEIAIWGRGNFNEARLKDDVSKIVLAHANLFGGLPYEHYTFIVHLSEDGFGGLEHHNSTLLLYPSMGFNDSPPGAEFDASHRPNKSYLNFLRLVSHEHFHTWNVKRIRPEVLGPFDYQHENYTRDLWTVEGITSYYENVGLLNSSLISGEHFLELIAKAVQILEQTPGRLLHDLETSSFNAWVKLYRPDEHTKNSSVSYYLKGELVCFALDLFLRAKTQNKHSLDDVLQLLWQHYVDTGEGYKEDSYAEWILKATGVDVSAEIQTLIKSTEEIDWQHYLAPCGLQLEKSHKQAIPSAWTGVQTKDQQGQLRVTFVPTDSPAYHAGIYAGDEIIAFDHWRVSSTADWNALLQKYAPNHTTTVLLNRRGQILEKTITTAAPPADTYAIKPLDDLTQEQRELLSSWLSLTGQ